MFFPQKTDTFDRKSGLCQDLIDWLIFGSFIYSSLLLSYLNPVISPRMMTAQTCSLRLFKMTNYTRWSETCKKTMSILNHSVVGLLFTFPPVKPFWLICVISWIPVFWYTRCHRKQRSEKYIMTGAKLIAPAVEISFAAGFDWFVLLF